MLLIHSTIISLTIGNKIGQSIPGSPVSYQQFLKGNYVNSFYLTPVTKYEVSFEILSLTNAKSAGPNGITNLYIEVIVTVDL